MIPRTPNLHLNFQNSNMNRPASPKFGSNYGLRPPQNNRQTLIDQIINNCKRAQSPLNNRIKTSDKHNYIKIDTEQDYNKENSRNFDRMSRQKNSLNKRQSYESQPFNSSRQSCQGSFKEKKIGHNQNSNNSSTNYNQMKRGPQQYFPRPFSKFVPHSPTYKFKTQFQGIKPRRPDSVSRQQSLKILENMGQEHKTRQRIQQQKIKLIQHCKRQQRKLRIYYVELENKLCQMRNKQLRMLAQFQSHRLKQLDEYQRSVHNNQETTGKLQQLNKNHYELRVNEQIKPQIRGCMITGVSGLFFSFDQTNTDIK